MNERIEQLKVKIEPLRNQIINHRVYGSIKELEDVQLFMKFHIYAVWDFMSLLKGLQNSLTCTTVPWFPKGLAQNRRLINEIVVGEESDMDPEGNIKSHFELYLDAMKQCGADTKEISQFIGYLATSGDLASALTLSGTAPEAKEFVEFTFRIINTRKDYLLAAVFTFGREDLIPGMFYSLVNDLYKQFPENISIFKYYLERHIQIDGDEHSHLALQMTSNLCKEDENYWQEVEKEVINSLQKRINLWDGVLKMIEERKKAMKPIRVGESSEIALG